MVLGGFLLFSSTATTYVTNPAFRVKLGRLVPVALVWRIVVQQKARVWGHGEEPLPAGKLAGLMELLLWIAVITATVEIPNY